MVGGADGAVYPMKLLDILASPIWSSVTGGLGAVVTGVLAWMNKREDNKENAAKRAHELQLTTLMGQLDQAKFAATLAQVREQGAAEAFTETIKADAASHRGAKWVQSFREATRPALTWLYQVAFIVLLALSLIAWWKQWCGTYEILPLIEYMVIAIINAASFTLSWWFGQRQIDRAAISWGNKTFNGNVTPSTPKNEIKK
jgi:hypothetical protein